MRPPHRAAFGPRSSPNLVFKRVPPTRPRRTPSSRTRVGTGPRRAHRLRSTSPNCGTDPTTHRDATTTRRGTDSRSDRGEKTRPIRPGTQPTRQPKPALPRATTGHPLALPRLSCRATLRAACPLRASVRPAEARTAPDSTKYPRRLRASGRVPPSVPERPRSPPAQTVQIVR